MFTKELAENECIIIDEWKESKLNTSIHMFFMFFDIAVIWADKNLKVVDVGLVKAEVYDAKGKSMGSTILSMFK